MSDSAGLPSVEPDAGDGRRRKQGLMQELLTGRTRLI